MKLYLFDTFERFNRLSRSLDAKTYLCNKTWNVFNDGGEKESYKFKEDGSMIVVLSGRISKGNWVYDPNDNTIEIYFADQAYMVHPSLLQDILVLNIDGTKDCAFLVDEKDLERYTFSTYSGLIEYFENEERKRIEEEENRKRIEAEVALDRQNKIKQKRLKETYLEKFKEILLCNKYKYKSYPIFIFLKIIIIGIFALVSMFVVLGFGVRFIPESNRILGYIVGMILFGLFMLVVNLFSSFIESLHKEKEPRDDFDNLFESFIGSLPEELKKDAEFRNTLYYLGTSFNYKKFKKE